MRADKRPSGRRWWPIESSVWFLTTTNICLSVQLHALKKEHCEIPTLLSKPKQILR